MIADWTDGSQSAPVTYQEHACISTQSRQTFEAAFFVEETLQIIGAHTLPAVGIKGANKLTHYGQISMGVGNEYQFDSGI